MHNREKRKMQSLCVFKLKLDTSHFNKIQKYFLSKVFIEAKWFYNYILSLKDPFNKDTIKIKDVKIKVQDVFEDRKLEVLSAQMRQGLHTRVCDAITTLSKLKKLNFKVGKLQFKSEINVIDFVQHNVTWEFKSKKYVRIQGCKKYFKVHGVAQLPKNAEFANAKLIRKASGYYLHVTTYAPLETKGQTGGPYNAIIAATPVINPDNIRGEEIQAWMDRAKERGKDISHYIIIDDDSDMLPEQMEFFIKTDMRTGLTTKAALQAIEILNRT